jgi:glycosyltransferase involved in cell wall biosynthesis
MNKESANRVPSISIGMPVFNDACFIHEALDSLLAQTFSDFELIISDDASSDGSQEICLEYARKDSRIHYFRQPKNLGIQQNMEFVLQQAQGEYFMWAADDDIWESDFIFSLLQPLKMDSRLIMAFCPYSFIDDTSQPILSRGCREIDYSSKSRFIRIVKLCYFYDDGCGYGIFRTKSIQGVHYPIWWGINRKTALNNIYPPLFFFLSRGNYQMVRENVLWKDRIKKHSNHSKPISASKIFRYLAYLLRKVNVWYESLVSVNRGSHSLFLTAAVLPFISVRCIYDCMSPIFEEIRSLMKDL